MSDATRDAYAEAMEAWSKTTDAMAARENDRILFQRTGRTSLGWAVFALTPFLDDPKPSDEALMAIKYEKSAADKRSDKGKKENGKADKKADAKAAPMKRGKKC